MTNFTDCNIDVRSAGNEVLLELARAITTIAKAVNNAAPTYGVYIESAKQTVPSWEPQEPSYPYTGEETSQDYP